MLYIVKVIEYLIYDYYCYYKINLIIEIGKSMVFIFIPLKDKKN